MPYVPALHNEHADAPAALVDPATHWVHELACVAPTNVENHPAAHGVHAPAPTVLAYLPAEHATHATDDDAPTVALAVPRGHSVQDATLL